MAWDEVVSEAILRLDHEGRRIGGSYSYRGGFSHLVTDQEILGGRLGTEGELRLELGPPTFPTSEEPAPRSGAPIYSARKASMGCIRAARRAGK